MDDDNLKHAKWIELRIRIGVRLLEDELCFERDTSCFLEVFEEVDLMELEIVVITHRDQRYRVCFTKQFILSCVLIISLDDQVFSSPCLRLRVLEDEHVIVVR